MNISVVKIPAATHGKFVYRIKEVVTNNGVYILWPDLFMTKAAAVKALNAFNASKYMYTTKEAIKKAQVLRGQDLVFNATRRDDQSDVDFAAKGYSETPDVYTGEENETE